MKLILIEHYISHAAVASRIPAVVGSSTDGVLEQKPIIQCYKKIQKYEI